MLLTATPGAAELSIVSARPDRRTRWVAGRGRHRDHRDVGHPADLVASEASMPATTTRQSRATTSRRRAGGGSGCRDVVHAHDLGAGHPRDEGGLGGDGGVPPRRRSRGPGPPARAAGRQRGHRGGVHRRVRVVLAGQRDERLGRRAEHQGGPVRVLAPASRTRARICSVLRPVAQMTSGSAAASANPAGRPGCGVGQRTQQRLGGAAEPQRRVGGDQERSEAGVVVVVQRGRLHVRDTNRRVVVLRDRRR